MVGIRRYFGAVQAVFLSLAFLSAVFAHEGNMDSDKEHSHDNGGHHMNPDLERLPEEAQFFNLPAQSMGWALRSHSVLCIVAYLILLPTAYVMELSRHKLQTLVQLAGALTALVGISLGWAHGHINNVYGRFGWFMLVLLVTHTTLNLTLSLGIIKRSKTTEKAYRLIGGIQSVFTYVGMVFGCVTYLGICGHGHLGQCISHLARGSALVIASVSIVITMRLFGPVLLELGRPIEFYESLIMMLVGIIGTFTEHNFFQRNEDSSDSWSHKDLQHTLIGISWLAGGLLGVVMTWRAHPTERTPIPSLIFIATGIAMIIHQQDLKTSTYIHFLFGASLVSLGFSTICEITLISSGFIKQRGNPHPFQFVPIFFMCASGIFLMGANRDMVMLLINSGIDIATYALILLSFCFLIVFYFNVLIDAYYRLAGPASAKYHQIDNDEHSGNTLSRISTSTQASTLNHDENDNPGHSPHHFAA